MSLKEKSAAFLDYLDNWMAGLEPLNWEKDFAKLEKTAIISVDIIKGFCVAGPLSSPRVTGIVAPIVVVFKNYNQRGGKHILLVQDDHEPEAVEFDAFAPHCVRGTEEAETIDEFKRLPFFEEMQMFFKNSISTGFSTEFDQWVVEHPEVTRFIVVGDCTDLCTYQLAMHLRLQANNQQLQREIITPANCIETYDMTIETAAQFGIMPHDGDFLHTVFLYHMALNGIQVVSEIK